MENSREKKIHPLVETLGLVYMAENLDAVKSDMLVSLEEMNIDGVQFYKQNLSYLENYVGEFKKHYVLNDDERCFFEHHTEFFLTILAMTAALSEMEDRDRTDKGHIISMMYEFLCDEASEKKQSLNTVEDCFLLLRSAPYSEDTKWRLLEVFDHPVGYFQRLFEIYENNRQAFDYTCRKNKKELDKLIDKAPSDISDAMKKIVSEFGSKDKVVYITAVFPLMEWMTPMFVFQGVLADQLDLYKKNLRNAKELLPQILKLLGDKSKFEILCLLKSGGKYNLEIAEELGLTPATASHHMNMLLSNQIVTVEKKDGRVYYQLNRETLKDIMRLFEEILM